MCRGVAVSELAARIPGVLLSQMWVCDLVMGRFNFILGGEQIVSGIISKVQAADL